MQARIGLTDQQRAGVVNLLNATLADEYVLYTKTRAYHWNVTGAHFHDLHKFFESQYETLDARIDEIAEFIRSMGEMVTASMAAFQSSARLKEDTGEAPTAEEMIVNLLEDHEGLIRNLREDVEAASAKNGAVDAADFLTGLMEEHEKMAWMLRAMLE